MVLILALACAARHEPERATTALPVLVVPVLETLDGAPVRDTPEALDGALLAALQARNFVPSLAAPARYVEGFTARRDTERRVEFLAEPGLVLLVETQASYYSELSGRYRWTVQVHVSLPPSQLVDTFDVPVFLQFHHEGPDEAVGAASPVIARRVGQLADRYLSAL